MTLKATANWYRYAIFIEMFLLTWFWFYEFYLKLLMICRRSKHLWYGIFLVANPKNQYFQESSGKFMNCGNTNQRSPSLVYNAKHNHIIVKHDMNKRNCGAKFYIRKVKFASNKTSTFKISQEMENGKLMFKVWLTNI